MSERPTKTELLPPLRPAGLPRPADGMCTWDGAGIYEPCRSPHFARGLCDGDYRLVRRRDDPEFRAKALARARRWRERQAGAR